MRSDSQSRVDDGTLRRYLLGNLPEPELTRVEQQMFADETVYDQLSGVEDDLIDTYAAGRLDRAERARFEEVYLVTPEGRARVAFACSLHQSLAESAPSQKLTSIQTRWAAFLNSFTLWDSPVWAASAVAALLAVTGVGGLLVDRWLRPVPVAQDRRIAETRPPASGPDPRLGQLKAQLEQTEAERRKLKQQLAQRSSPAPTLPLAFVLSPGLVRDEGSSVQLRVPAGENAVQLTLELENPQAGPYRAVLETAGGVEIWSQAIGTSGRGMAKTSVIVRIPARILNPDDFHLVLSRQSESGTWELASDYSFRVRRN